MKIIINKKLLDETLEIVSKFTDPISSLYGMRCIKIIANNQYVVFQASNEITNIIKKIKVDDKNIIVEESGEIVVQCSFLKNIVKKLNGIIELSTIYNKMEIKEQDSKYTLTLNDLNSFPNIDENINIKKFEINTEEFKKAIKNVAFAASTGASLIYKCINFKSSGNKLNLAATDVYRLAHYSIKTNAILNDFEFSVNAKDVKEMVPVDAPKKITLFYNSIKFGVEYDNTIITARITDLPYHDVEQLFNQVLTDFKYKITIQKNELNSLLNKIWINPSVEKQNRIELKTIKNELSIFSRLEEYGDSIVKTNNFQIEGGNIIFDINYNFLKDAIAITEGEIYIIIDEKIQKIMIISKDNPNSKQIVTPLRR
ncbi:DNA polymerase III subunit beta [Mycoplasmopsis primatum]|uniref:DNA polymerase III subunit beta n=1 Tax=Mycoplasmopsis primatum TaxID=55604 RepID=UPI000496F3F8|nr:DNA polymerase III subunit beta [Mycoplasmopsis primatum]